MIESFRTVGYGSDGVAAHIVRGSGCSAAPSYPADGPETSIHHELAVLENILRANDEAAKEFGKALDPVLLPSSLMLEAGALMNSVAPIVCPVGERIRVLARLADCTGRYLNTIRNKLAV